MASSCADIRAARVAAPQAPRPCRVCRPAGSGAPAGRRPPPRGRRASPPSPCRVPAPAPPRRGSRKILLERRVPEAVERLALPGDGRAPAPSPCGSAARRAAQRADGLPFIERQDPGDEPALASSPCTLAVVSDPRVLGSLPRARRPPPRPAAAAGPSRRRRQPQRPRRRGRGPRRRGLASLGVEQRCPLVQRSNRARSLTQVIGLGVDERSAKRSPSVLSRSISMSRKARVSSFTTDSKGWRSLPGTAATSSWR
jgi:hypothetical protein